MAAETVAVISVLGSILVSIIAQIQNSRCTHISCGCISCDRDTATIDEIKKDDPPST